MKVDVLYLAYNRLAFTRTSFGMLIANTDWSLVDRLVVYDDGSTDGTLGYLRGAIEQVPGRVELRRKALRSPVAVMLDYLDDTDADVFAKIDNDIALPHDWLAPAIGVLEDSPTLDLLGLAAGWLGRPRGNQAEWGYVPASHIGGVGLMRTSAFRRFRPLEPNGRFGFTEWQHETAVRSGWIDPDINAVQLDLIPDEPWADLARRYVVRNWSRKWPPYDQASRSWWANIPEPSLVKA